MRWVLLLSGLILCSPSFASSLDEQYDEATQWASLEAQIAAKKDGIEFSGPDGFKLKYRQCADDAYQCILDQAKLSVAAPYAYKGSYAAQRFLAYCLSGRCDPFSVEKNATLACAWRLVISSSGSPELDGDDAEYLEQDCGSLSPVAREQALKQSESLAGAIRQ